MAGGITCCTGILRIRYERCRILFFLYIPYYVVRISSSDRHLPPRPLPGHVCWLYSVHIRPVFHFLIKSGIFEYEEKIYYLYNLKSLNGLESTLNVGCRVIVPQGSFNSLKIVNILQILHIMFLYTSSTEKRIRIVIISYN